MEYTGDARLIFFLLLLFATFSFLLAWRFSRGTQSSKAGFLVANRSLGVWEAAFSIAASWIWAPALFISAQKAYTDGLIGFAWFLVPNVLCLILFAFFAEKIRRQVPHGFTLSDYIRTRYSPRVQNIYWFTLVGLSVCAFAVQLLAGGLLMAKITGVSYFGCTLVLTLIPLSYSLFFGLKSSVVTDYAKMIFIFSLSLLLIPWVVISVGGSPVLWEGLRGQAGSLDVFSKSSWLIFISFGLPTSIGLISGPFGDQSFWQRAFAVQEGKVKSAFLWAAFLFALVPLSMSILGFIAAGSKLEIKDPQMVNMETIQHFLPAWTIVPFMFLILSGLISILDSKLAAISSIGGHDILNRIRGNQNHPLGLVLRGSRWSMILLALAALAVANIPGLKILHLFLFYGTIRSATLLPTLLTILGKKLPEVGVFWGVLTSILIGLPVFVYGNFSGQPLIAAAGSLVTILAPLAMIRFLR